MHSDYPTVATNYASPLRGSQEGSIKSAQDYYPFGMQMPSRTFSSDKYRFGFNGKENDNEVKGTGNSLDYGARIYDSRLGRWLSMDPLAIKTPDISPFTFSFNNPILFKDPDGKTGYVVIVHNPSGDGGTVFIVATYYVVKGNVDNNGFSNNQIAEIKQLQSDLNNQNAKIPKDIMYNGKNLNGYNVQFIFNVQEVNNLDDAQEKMNTISFEIPISADGSMPIDPKSTNNIIGNYSPDNFRNLDGTDDIAKKNGVDVTKLSGITSEDRNRIAKQDGVIAYNKNGGSFKNNILHEIFHTLLMDLDGCYQGIGKGNTTDLKISPNALMEVIMNLINNGNVKEANSSPNENK